MGLGGVAIATLPSVICAKLMFSDGLGGGRNVYYICMRKPRPHCKYRHFHAWRNIDLLVQKMERNAKK